MAKGFDANQERLRLLGLLGKPLARRSGRRCELCEAAGDGLRPFEVPPAPAEPELEHTLLLCNTCRDQIEDPRKIRPSRWRPLQSAIWSTEPVIQVMAARVLQRLADRTDWAQETLESVDLEPDIAAWVAKES